MVEAGPEAGKVVLYQPARALGVPNPSPFCVKLECWLRMTGIAYEIETVRNPGKGPKGKIPWIQDGRRSIGDSQFIIDHLKKTRGVDPDAPLTPGRRGRAEALRAMVEERLYFAAVWERWIGPAWPATREMLFGFLPPGVRDVAAPLVRRRVKQMLHLQGIGRHTPEEITQLAANDLAWLSMVLGDDPLFCGAEEPTTLDAVVYGMLVNLIRVDLDTPICRAARGHANLVAHTWRIGSRYFPEFEPDAG